MELVEVYVGRQPILNTKQDVFGYELLYRNSMQNKFANIDGDQATSSVITSFMEIGIKELSEGKPCFINFTENLLEYLTPTVFPPHMIVVEILETVNPTDHIINSCKELKKMGYKIALDDFEWRGDQHNFIKLLELADIIKIDTRLTPRPKQIVFMQLLKKYNVQFLAEKVETMEEYEQCLQDGYTYFQGYFFSKPTILSTKDVPAQHQNFLVMMNELSKEEPDVLMLARFIEADISLSYKLLKLINSPIMGISYQIKSIQQAIVYLGFKELKKWIFLLSLREKSKKKEKYIDEVIKMSFIRAKASELIALEKGFRHEASSYFLVGLLSLMDTLMQQPLEKLLKQLPLDPEIKHTLMGQQTKYVPIYQLVLSLEKSNWDTIENLAYELQISRECVYQIHVEAVKWTKEIMEGTI